MSSRNESGKKHPSSFVLSLKTYPNNWNIYNDTEKTYRIDSSGSFQVSEGHFGDEEEHSKSISKRGLEEIKNLISMLNPKSIPSGKLGSYVSDGSRRTITLVWGKIEREWDSDNDWGPYNGIVKALIEKIIGLDSKED
jgi:hypothetical protein